MDNINWNLIRMTVEEKIDNLKAEIMYCGCTENNNYKVPKLKQLVALYEEQYKKLMILLQETCKKEEPIMTVELKYNKSDKIDQKLVHDIWGTLLGDDRKLETIPHYDAIGDPVGRTFKIFKEKHLGGIK